MEMACTRRRSHAKWKWRASPAGLATSPTGASRDGAGKRKMSATCDPRRALVAAPPPHLSLGAHAPSCILRGGRSPSAPDLPPKGATLTPVAPDATTTRAAILEAGREIWVSTVIVRGCEAKWAARRGSARRRGEAGGEEELATKWRRHVRWKQAA